MILRFDKHAEEFGHIERVAAAINKVVDEAPEGVPPVHLPAQPSVFAPDYAPQAVVA